MYPNTGHAVRQRSLVLDLASLDGASNRLLNRHVEEMEKYRNWTFRRRLFSFQLSYRSRMVRRDNRHLCRTYSETRSWKKDNLRQVSNHR